MELQHSGAARRSLLSWYRLWKVIIGLVLATTYVDTSCKTCDFGVMVWQHECAIQVLR